MKYGRIIQKFLGRGLSDAEHSLLTEWKQESQANIEEMKAIAKLHHIDLKDYTTFDTDAAFAKVEGRMIEKTPVQKTKTFSLRPILSVAAVMLFLCAVGLYLFRTDMDAVSSMTGHKTYASAKSISLEDGSVVRLDKKSSLDVTSDRKVTLHGRAYFDIQKDKNAPFVVRTMMGDITVLGTEFSVVTDSVRTEVYVTEGRVRYSDEHRSVILSVGDFLVDDGKGLAKVQRLSDNYLAWYDKDLKFQSTPLTQVIKDIAQAYDANIELATGLDVEACRLTAQYRDVSLKEILSDLREVLKLKYNKKGDTIVIVAAGCASE